MRILDRYIVKKFLAVLFFTTLAFIAIFIVVDLVEHLDTFITSNSGIDRTFLYYVYYFNPSGEHAVEQSVFVGQHGTTQRISRRVILRR